MEKFFPDRRVRPVSNVVLLSCQTKLIELNSTASFAVLHGGSSTDLLCSWGSGGGGGDSHTLPIRVCAAQRGRAFEVPDLEWGIHFRGVF